MEENSVTITDSTMNDDSAETVLITDRNARAIKTHNAQYVINPRTRQVIKLI